MKRREQATVGWFGSREKSSIGMFATIVTDIAISQRTNLCSIPIKETIPTVKGAILVKKNGYQNRATILLLESILQRMTDNESILVR